MTMERIIDFVLENFSYLSPCLQYFWVGFSRIKRFEKPIFPLASVSFEGRSFFSLKGSSIEQLIPCFSILHITSKLCFKFGISFCLNFIDIKISRHSSTVFVLNSVYHKVLCEFLINQSSYRSFAWRYLESRWIHFKSQFSSWKSTLHHLSIKVSYFFIVEPALSFNLTTRLHWSFQQMRSN